MVLSWYLCILARVLLSSHEVFSYTVNQLAQSHNDSEHHILSKMLDVWLTKMCNVSQIEQRKLLGMTKVNIVIFKCSLSCCRRRFGFGQPYNHSEQSGVGKIQWNYGEHPGNA